jgi:hypothetical protein
VVEDPENILLEILSEREQMRDMGNLERRIFDESGT